jgi:hypothetical protein
MPELPVSGLEYSPYGFEGLEARTEPPRALVRSANLEMAIGELSAYLANATGDLAMGRSCLIAGARGAGKTTMIDRAFQEARDNSQRRRLIRVRLHGPSLLNPPKPIPTKDNPNPAEIPVQEHVLKTLVINLYQTAAEEIANAFAGRANGIGKDGPEFGAQLRLTLDGAPSAGTLRFFWNRIGALKSGVLFEDADPDQGVREILALASAADAYRRCAGQFTQARTDALSAGEKAEAKTELSASGKEISKVLLGLASGVAAGATAAALTHNTPAIALAGAITTLVSMMTLSYSRTRSRESTLKEEMTFLPDTTVSGLVHRVLLLIRRLRQAGLVPVFIIDELDKVANPIEPLNKLTTSLKFLFADEGFFCFLTDRTYFAEITRRNREEANTTLRTIYNTQMLVRYDTASLNTFLKDVIHPYNLGGTITADQAADAEVLRYVLICRSRMLLFELSKDLRSFIPVPQQFDPVRQQNVERYVNPEFNAPRDNRAHQLHLAVQLAIELVLADEFVANRIKRDPIFAQTIYDALYYPVNLWYADQRRVDCSRASLVAGISAMIGEPLSLEDADEIFLQRQVKQLMELLVKLTNLEQRVADAINRGRIAIEHSGKLLDSIPRITLVKYTMEDTNPDIYKWNYTRSGIPYEASAIQDIQGNRDLWQALALIGALSKTIPELAAKRPSIDEVLLGFSAALAVIQSVTQLLIPAF